MASPDLGFDIIEPEVKADQQDAGFDIIEPEQAQPTPSESFDVIEPDKQYLSQIKRDYVSQGGNPLDVYAPERADLFTNELNKNLQSGLSQQEAMLKATDTLEALPPETRPDGSISAGYAPTEEAIVSAEFIKDRLIVFFERSTWELAYTGNQVLPFVWQKINTELGSEATFSVVPFDKVVLAIGNTGVHACNGSNVERIDTKIPDTVFEIFNKENGVSRVAGVRDYFNEMVYWSFPLDNTSINQEIPADYLQ